MGQPKPNRTVLLVDDEANIRKVVTWRLEREGFRVVATPSGDTGLSLAKSERPDVILLDIMMPLLNGREVLKRLREDPDTSTIPVILLTVVERDSDLESLLGSGQVFHVAKPYKAEELLRTIRLALGE